jgi:hypothetical protein
MRALASVAFLLLLAVSGLSGPVSSEKAAGELCFRGGSCVLTAGHAFDVEPRAVDRDFFWTLAEGTEAAAGRLEAGASRIDLEDAGWRAVTLAIDGADASIWPRDCRVLVTPAGKAAIRGTIPARRVAAIRKLRLPAGDAELELVAIGHRPVRRRLRGDGADLALGRVTFVPAPAVSGKVVDPKGLAVIGATIATPAGEIVATTDAAGAFRAELPEDWPSHLRVSAAGHGLLIVPLPKASAAIDVGRLVSAPGASLAIAIDGAERVDLEVRTRADGLAVVTRLGVRAETLFTGLAAGEYVLLVRGDGPLQQSAHSIALTAGENRLHVVIEPASLSIHVRHGDSPFANAALTIGPSGGDWRGNVTTDGEGNARTEIWQRGEMMAFVRGEGSPATGFARTNLSASDELTWDISLPHRRIFGTVTDGHGRPVPAAALTLETRAGDSATEAATAADDAGRFEFGFIQAGRQTLTATAAQHVPAKLSFTMTDDDVEHVADLRLQDALEREISVVDLSGHPIANALVIEEANAGGEGWSTDAGGLLRIPFAAGERKTIYVVPAEGSFAIADVAAPSADDREATRVIVPPGSASIAIATRSTGGDAVGDVAVALRYNGRFVPSMVRARMLQRASLPLGTGHDGAMVLQHVPQGLYELWPVFTRADYSEIRNGMVAPPVRLAAEAGENRVEMTFERRK